MSNPFAGGPQGPGQQPQQPYGQVPPQQPYGGQPQQPNFYAGPPVQPPQQQRRPWLKWLRIGVPIVIAIVAAVVYFTKDESAAESAKVGDCMEHIKKDGHDDVKKADCGTPKGQYTVVGKFPDTIDKDKCATVANWEQDPGVYFYMDDNGSKVLLCLNANPNSPDPLS
ncbi:MAG TPA: hypothetical protein VLH10_20065 [Yinghuangia sp.]|nr:hypothetical protein [Yinghuangia sp.]